MEQAVGRTTPLSAPSVMKVIGYTVRVILTFKIATFQERLDLIICFTGKEAIYTVSKNWNVN